jgi:inositol 1,4,5-triphosphate receptor type 1/inositol 1,4,5-triphosphate receptor type 3
LILSAIYIKTGVSLLLIIPILAIANINKILGNIFSAMIQNIRHMSLVILFIFMITYIYSWFSFYFLDEFFNFEVMEYESKQMVEEAFCKSSIQCFLYVTQYGLTAGGGVGETLDYVSYKESPGIFVLRFFYDVLFFSFVTLILLNIFTGIIVGAFAELRDETNKNENDKKNYCFICQLTRDDCLKKNIDFENHVKKEHFIWNYLYFLTYLHINDPNNFNSIENYVWTKLGEQDITWIPFKGDAE